MNAPRFLTRWLIAREIERNIALIHAPARKARSLSAHRGERTKRENRKKRQLINT